jgi:hypothetical protein
MNLVPYTIIVCLIFAGLFALFVMPEGKQNDRA